jgi:hypothetical protein
MSSPFPGVDPYLERQGFWSDFHATFITYWREAVADLLPDTYEARIDERVNLVEVRPEKKIKRIEPDLAVTKNPSAPAASAPVPATVGTLEPVTIPLVIEDERHETYIEILHRPERALVAVLELLSPSNKEEPGHAAYLAKRNTLLNHNVHLVELDLLLAGNRLPLAEPLPPAHFYALISRSDRRPDCNVYAWSVRQRLPAIPIPLLAPDPDVWLDLAALFATVYQRGRYRRSIDYSGAPPTALDQADRDWVAEVARQAQP